ncbi:hypothetical protein HZH68_014303 [Vespula germanica]|uniref:Uncharacterized protein n=1 Tax=Vespula germanica TaxID=30212 RepID=A0A834JFL5_VESGE|nr:hypothetical protein HZH68_014303 [Vespula germanica]
MNQDVDEAKARDQRDGITPYDDNDTPKRYFSSVSIPRKWLVVVPVIVVVVVLPVVIVVVGNSLVVVLYFYDLHRRQCDSPIGFSHGSSLVEPLEGMLKHGVGFAFIPMLLESTSPIYGS